MEAKDRLLTDDELWVKALVNLDEVPTLEDESQYPIYGFRAIAKAQAELSFKAGEEAGRREVVKLFKFAQELDPMMTDSVPICKHRDRYTCLRKKLWDPQLEAWGLGVGDKEQSASRDKGITS